MSSIRNTQVCNSNTYFNRLDSIYKMSLATPPFATVVSSLDTMTWHLCNVFFNRSKHVADASFILGCTNGGMT